MSACVNQPGPIALLQDEAKVRSVHVQMLQLHLWSADNASEVCIGGPSFCQLTGLFHVQAMHGSLAPGTCIRTFMMYCRACWVAS